MSIIMSVKQIAGIEREVTNSTGCVLEFMPVHTYSTLVSIHQPHSILSTTTKKGHYYTYYTR